MLAKRNSTKATEENEESQEAEVERGNHHARRAGDGAGKRYECSRGSLSRQYNNRNAEDGKGQDPDRLQHSLIVVIGGSEPVFDPGILESKELARQGHEIVSLRSSGESAMPSEVSTLIEGLVSFEVLDRIYLQPAAVNIDGLDWAMLID